MMRRRELFITALASTAASTLFLPVAAQPSLPVIGMLVSYTLDRGGQRLMGSFREGLRETGHDEGRNVRIEYRSAEGRYEQLGELAADLARRNVNVIAAVGGSPAALAAQRVTATIPVVFQVGVDPVEAGLVASLNRPGGNVTGIANLALQAGPKRLQVMKELFPAAEKLAVLMNPARVAAQTELKELEAAASSIGVRLHVLNAATDSEIQARLSEFAQTGASGLIIHGDPYFNSRSEQIATIALRYGVATIYQFPEFTSAGGLISYGSNLSDAYRLAGAYTGRVLKGEKPGDLPVQQSTKLELIVNLRVAKALGIDVPPTLLARADEVIE